MGTIDLPGLTARPLAAYLSAIGLFRVVASQADPGARASWTGDHLALHTVLDEPGLRAFLSERYSPTPLVAPWNGSDQGGLRPGATSRAAGLVDWISTSDQQRLDGFRKAVKITRSLVHGDRWQRLADSSDKGAKASMVRLARNALPDDALPFFDAAVALTGDGIHYPPIFGTGGNIGRLDLVTNYIEHLKRIIEPGKADRPDDWLDELLSGHARPGVSSTPGQFDYQGVGGPNQGRGAPASERVNPWTYVLSIEGALAFAASATRRLGASRSSASAPFSVAATAAGFASAAASENSKGEMWMPVWTRCWSWPELSSLLAEGRARWGDRPARDGTDLLRSVQTLGVDRGIDRFERYALLERNGQSPASLWLSTVRVDGDSRRAVRLTAELDDWLRRLERGADNKTPASVGSVRRRVRAALYQASDHPDPDSFRSLLLLVAEAERTVFRSAQFREASGIGPVPSLSTAWMDAIDPGPTDLEFVVARLLSVGLDPRTGAPGPPRSLRSMLRPIREPEHGRWLEFRDRGPVVPGQGSRPITDLLCDVAVYRSHALSARPEDDDVVPRGVHLQFEVAMAGADDGDQRARRGLVERFAAGQLDEHRIAEWLDVLLLLAPTGRAAAYEANPTSIDAPPVPLWRLLAPWFAQRPLHVELPGGGPRWTFAPGVPRTWAAQLRAAGTGTTASLVRAVAAGYRARGVQPRFDVANLVNATTAAIEADHGRPRRALAALMVPTNRTDLLWLLATNTHLPEGAPT